MSHVAINRAYWNGIAHEWVAGGERLWALPEPTWGIWATSDADAQLLPADMTGMDAIELGCGTAYISGWMAKRGAAVTGVDISDKQLATAQRLAEEHGVNITLIEGDAERTGLPSESFDFAVSEYGAAIWCDPDIWLREAHRLLRSGGSLAFLGNHPMTIVTAPLSGAPCEQTLHRPYRGLTGADWTNVEIDPAGIEFNRTMAGWITLFHEIGFEITGYRELYAGKDQDSVEASVPAAWARDYPSEQVWWLKKL